MIISTLPELFLSKQLPFVFFTIVILNFRDMSNPNVEYLGVMAWAAQFQWIQDKIAPGDRVQIQCSANKIRVGDEVRIF